MSFLNLDTKNKRSDLRISKAIRTACGATGKPYPILVIDGFSAPRLAGRSYYWTTLSGKTEVRHPNAYKWPTWYHQSTRHIVVGAGWLVGQGLV